MDNVKKKIRPGAIQLHAEEAALVVQYEVQEVATQADGSQEVISSSQATKKITVKSLSERTDLQALAAEIVDKCKLIHPSKTGLVQSLLQQLQRRELGLPDTTTTASADAARPTTSSSTGSGRHSQPQQQQQHAASWESAAAASSGSSASSATAAGPGPSSAYAARPVSRPAGQQGSGRPASARPQSAASRPHTSNSSGSSRGGTPQQQQQQLMQQQQQQQQCRLLQSSEAFQAYAQALTKSRRPAFIEDLEVYIDTLYEEELPQRAAAADMLCQLFRNSANMQALLARETLLSTLARLLREDGPRSLDMATAVGGCFYACSCIKDLHRQMLDLQVGSMLMDLAALELQRTAARKAQEGPGTSAAAIAASAAATAAVAGAAGAGGSKGSSGRQQQQQQQQQFDQRQFRLLSLVVNQDHLLFISLAALLNLAEEPAVARKMVRKDVVALLVGVLQRPHLELLLLGTSFLRRLCVFAESKARLASHPSIIPQLVSLLQPGCGEQLQCGVLRLLHNLSFDGALRQQMMAAGLVQQAVPLLDAGRAAPLAAGLLYQLSLDDAARAAFCYCPGALNRLLDSIMRALGPSNNSAGGGGCSTSPGGLRTIPELIALAVNVAHSSGVAEWFAEGERLARLLQRALSTADELAWKLLRNLAVSGGSLVAPCLLAQAHGMLNMLQSQETGPELFVEVLGTLATAADAACGSGSSDSSDAGPAAACGSDGGCGGGTPPWHLMQGVVLEELLAFLAACFQPGVLEDDALLESVVLLGALAGWSEGDRELAHSGLLHQLVDLLPAKRADDEFVLQVCWAFRRALMQPGSASALLAHDQVVMYIVDLVQDPCVAVSRVAASCLDVIIDTSEDMAGAIRSLKFEAFNQEWLKLAGPEAHELMAAAAVWQQQQLQMYIQQQQQQHIGDDGDGGELSAVATPYNTMLPGGQQNQQQPRRDATNGSYYSEQQFGQGDYFGGTGRFAAAAAADGDGAEYAYLQQQQDEEEDERQQQQQQLQWQQCDAGAGPASLAACGRSSSIGRPSMVTAGGQCMVLDFDAFVSDGGGGGQ